MVLILDYDKKFNDNINATGVSVTQKKKKTAKNNQIPLESTLAV